MSPPRVHASLRIGGAALDLDGVTQALRLAPDRVQRGGAQREGLWVLSSEGRVAGAELDAHLRWLLEQIEPRGLELQRLRERGAWAQLCCHGVAAAEEAPLSAATLGRCVALSLPVESARSDGELAESE